MSADRRKNSGAFAMVLMLASGCAGPTSGPDAGGADALPRLRLVEELRAGSLDDPNIGFTRIDDIAAAPDGRVFVAEWQSRQVRVFDAEGRFLRAIGRQGAGPGEFQAIARLGVNGDTLWVIDEPGGRTTLFTLDGEVIETLRPPPAAVPSLPGVNFRLLAWDIREDGLFNSFPRWSANTSAVPENRALAFDVPYVVFDREGNVVDHLYLGSMRLSDILADFVALAGRQLVVPKPPSADPLVLPWSRGLYVVERPLALDGTPAVFAVTSLGELGDTLFRRELAYSPKPHSAEGIEIRILNPTHSYVNAVLRDQGPADTATARAQALARIRSALSFPPIHPPVSAGRVGADGALWLKREEEPAGCCEWMILAADGSALGSVTIPGEVTVRWSSGSLAWASVPDEHGVPWLVRYRIDGLP